MSFRLMLVFRFLSQRWLQYKSEGAAQLQVCPHRGYLDLFFFFFFTRCEIYYNTKLIQSYSFIEGIL